VRALGLDPFLLLNVCAGLRSRGWAGARLGCGRAAGELPLEDPSCVSIGLGETEGFGAAAALAEIEKLFESAETDSTGGASIPSASSSWSRPRKKYSEDAMEELA